jgi:hypothetical protein
MQELFAAAGLLLHKERKNLHPQMNTKVSLFKMGALLWLACIWSMESQSSDHAYRGTRGETVLPEEEK